MSNQASEIEQAVCLECGFCCDGTLFMHAVLKPGERGFLPVKIEEHVFSEEGKDYFRLPCDYFAGKCTIYNRKRADVCGAYRCQLIRDLTDKKISFNDALAIVKEALSMRSELMVLYWEFSGVENKVHFRQMLHELGKYRKLQAGNEDQGTEYEVIQARFNIFEALLIKHFRSAEDFDKMIMK